MLQAAESIFSSNEEYAPPPPTTDPGEIRAFIESVRPEVSMDGRRMRIGNNLVHLMHVRFDEDEDEEIETTRACLDQALARETERLVEETTEIPGGRWARDGFRDRIQPRFQYVVYECLNQVLEHPLALPELPEPPGTPVSSER